MSLPTLEKTWQVSHVSNSLLGTETLDTNDLFLKFKAAAKAFGSNPLTVVGSSDSSTANMSGTDLLVVDGDMVHDSPGSPHSWVVLALDQIAAGAQVCFDFNSTDTIRQDIIVSATGFSGGTTSARPTAADEIVVWSNNAWTGMFGSGDGSGGQIRAHIMLSDDGECFRVILANNGIVGGFLLIDKPANPATGWATPMVTVMKGTGRLNNTSDSVLTVADWYNSDVFQARGPSAIMPMFATFESPGNFFTVATKLNAANEISGEYLLMRVGMWHSATVGQRGRHGFIHDLWFTNQVLQNGDTMPSDASKQFVVFGDGVFPGDGTNWATG